MRTITNILIVLLFIIVTPFYVLWTFVQDIRNKRWENKRIERLNELKKNIWFCKELVIFSYPNYPCYNCDKKVGEHTMKERIRCILWDGSLDGGTWPKKITERTNVK